MPITSFKIENEKVIKLAECERVPKVMIIAGPNGVGKSTLLDALRRRAKTRQGVKISGNPKILYLGPHRVWRRTNIRASILWERWIRQMDILASDKLPTGINLGIPPLHPLPRGPNYPDEAQSFVKYRLAQIETRYMSIIKRKFDEKGYVTKDEIPDIYKPLRDLISFFLPHLRFVRIDLERRENVRVIFQNLKQPTSTGYLELDVDDLSSGEKELIAFFLPIVEAQIERELAKIEGQPEKSEEEIVVLIDTPEMHLHPALQLRLLEYMRELSERENIQFIVVTHSPVLVNNATHEELYILTFPEPYRVQNQLLQVSTQPEKLEVIRSVLGDTSVLTAGRPIILIEGESPKETTKVPSDKRLLELLCPDFKNYILIPFQDKGKIISFIKSLEGEYSSLAGRLQIFAILDRDRERITDKIDELGRIFVWPVCSIENFLLDSHAIWHVLQPYKEKLEKLGLESPEDVEIKLRRIAEKIKEEEIKIRAEELKKLGKEDFEAYKEASEEVDRILKEGKELRLFRGKEILIRFYEECKRAIGMNKEAFYYSIAREIGKQGCPEEIRRIIQHIDAFVPLTLPGVLEDLAEILSKLGVEDPIIGEIRECANIVENAVKERLKLQEPKVDRRELKQKLFQSLMKLRNNLDRLIEDEQDRKVVEKLINEAETLVSMITTPV